MKRFLITFSIVLCFLQALPQKSADVGIRIGAAAYWGDIESVDYSKSMTPLYGVLGRWNFNKRMSIRGQLIVGNLKATGTFPGVNLAEPTTKTTIDEMGNIVPLYLYLKNENNSFSFKRAIQSFEAIFEFNFMDYRMGSITKERFTPFLSLGVGGFFSRSPLRQGTLVILTDPLDPIQKTYKAYLEEKNNEPTNNADASSPIIPMGFGIKYNLTKRLGMCVELCVRKTFMDNIDNLKDPNKYQNVILYEGVFQPPFTTNPFFNNDWYASLHLSLHWQVWTDKGICKVSDKKVKKSAF